jgi:uncharacterized membrane protein YqgA involved in biofilm formation
MVLNRLFLLWVLFSLVSALTLALDRLFYIPLQNMRLPVLLVLGVIDIALGAAVVLQSQRRNVPIMFVIIGIVAGNWWFVEWCIVGLIWKLRGFAP